MLTLLTSLALTVAPQVPEAASFVFPAAIEVGEDRLYLGRIATCSGAARLCEEAYGVDLGASPAPGKSQTLGETKLRAALAAEWPGAALRLTFEGAGKGVKIVAAASPVTEAQVTDALRARVVGAFGEGDRFQVEVEKVQVPLGLATRPGDFAVDFPELTDAAFDESDWVRKHLLGHQRLKGALVKVGDAASPEVLSFPVQATFVLREQIPVVVESFPRGRILREDDLEMRWVEVLRGATRFATSPDALAGRRLTRSVSAFEPVPTNAVTVPEVVKRGQLVRLEMRGRGVAVTGKVEALESAGYGEAIDAVYPATKKKLRVRVVDSGTVEYLF